MLITPKKKFYSVAPTWGKAAGGGGGGSPPLDGLSPTAAWSVSRKLLTAYGGSFYTPTGSPTRANVLLDQSGNSRNLTPTTGSGPLISATSPVALQYNGAGAANTLLSAADMTTFITQTSGYMIMTVQFSAFTSNSVSYDNTALMQSGNQNYGLTVGGTGSSGTVYAVTYSADVSASVVLNTPYVLEFRIQSGTLYLRVNGTGEVSTAANTPSMSSFNFGSRAGVMLDGYIWEAATFSTAPTLAQRNALVQSLGLYVGASV